MDPLKHDFTLRLATAPSRLSKQWRNREVRWADLVKRCSGTLRTNETVAEYSRMSREEQSRIKDVGGFVAGYLKEGKRKTAAVTERSAVTLDLDFALPGTWEDFTLNCSNAALCYSTHKHRKEKPRLRLVIPSSRPMKPEEYEPIARAWARIVGIETADHTTYQLPRLFYWPSTSKDGDWFFDVIDGEPFNPDEILKQYRDYRDASEWPLSSREGEIIRRTVSKAADPTEKKGVIGAFCRAYTIEEAIEELLADVYAPTATEGRYTYINGTVAGGLVCYDGKFAYSHHESDPAGGRLCNAFDLVALHKFGNLDEGHEGESASRRPSYRAMMDFASADKRVRQLMGRERREECARDFAILEERIASDKAMTPEEVDAMLDGGDDPKKKNSIRNILTVLELDPNFKGRLWHDLFSGFDMVEGGLPWDGTATVWKSRDDANLRVYFENQYKITGRDKIKDAREAIYTKYSRHPIREYLDSLQWDGKPRLERMIIDYLGAEDNELTRAMTRKHFTAAVARVMEPGCKYDYCLVVTGKEGIGKSTLFNIMGGDWFSDSVVTTDGKSGMEQLRCGWIIELAELTSIKRADVETVKSYISRRDDIYRAAYASVVERHPRQCVFCGSTNEDYFLKGDYGNRRFWVVKAEPDLRAYSDGMRRLKEDRDQLWAEAVELYRKGEKLYLPHELEMQARQRQQEFNDNDGDPLRELLVSYLDTPLPTDWEQMDVLRRRAWMRDPDPVDATGVVRRDKVTAAEFICERLGRDMSDKDYKYLARKVCNLLRDLGWEPHSLARYTERLYGRQRWFSRPKEDEGKEGVIETNI